MTFLKYAASQSGRPGCASVNAKPSTCPTLTLKTAFGLLGEKDPLDVDYTELLHDEGPLPDVAPVGRGTVVAVDLLRMEPLPGVQTLQMDFLSPAAATYVGALLEGEGGDGKADVILSDMAANFTGNDTADIESSLTIAESVFEFTKRHLRTADSVGKKRAGVLV